MMLDTSASWSVGPSSIIFVFGLRRLEDMASESVMSYLECGCGSTSTSNGGLLAQLRDIKLQSSSICHLNCCC